MLKKIFDELKLHCGKFDTYFPVYERHLQKFINKSPIVVEVGICRGGSAEMWKKYFGPGATIVGIDIDQNAFKMEHKTEGCIQVYGNQGDPEFWNSFLKSYPEIDILIDDGGHHQYQQILTLKKVWLYLKVGGVFLCEDTHTSYWPEYSGGLKNQNSFMEFSKSVIDTINSDHIKSSDQSKETQALQEQFTNLVSMHYYDSIVVFEKEARIKGTLLTSTPI
jgi:23S rRNA U2552 (ribose-2'-O)-methylase RlmE/FtsJ